MQIRMPSFQFLPLTSFEMTIGNEIIRKHESAMRETLEKLLGSVAQGGDIHNDANISKMLELNLSLIRQYSESSVEALNELSEKQPSLMRHVSVNTIKRERVERSNRAILEREEKKLELMRKLKALRKNVPDSMRQKLESPAIP